MSNATASDYVRRKETGLNKDEAFHYQPTIQTLPTVLSIASITSDFPKGL
jgi:hypothetical protein